MAKAKFSPAYDELRSLLVKAREKAGMRQEDVAARLKRPQSYVSKIELGERRLDVVEYIEFTRAIKADAVRILLRLMKQSSEEKGGKQE
jgi:ribosome-binding protein aMBF1 (putative translation factor)